jgi:hypothetical protein
MSPPLSRVGPTTACAVYFAVYVGRDGVGASVRRTRSPDHSRKTGCLKALRIQIRIDYDYCVFYLASSDLISMFNLGALHLQLQLYLLYPYVSYIEIIC